jgi:organic hydroperoxide reductase OsmC/OhrA
MPDIEVESTCEEGFVTESRVGDFAVTIDATGEEGPTPNEMLVTDYASCYIPAFRVGAQQRGYDELGKVVIDAEGDLDDDDDLEAIRFQLKVEADLGEDADEIVSRGKDICHVHSAVREELEADIEITDNAF